MRLINLAIKRIFDILVSFIGCVILLIPFVILAAAIKVDSKGPVFFLQQRLGKKGKTFKIFKLRTMVQNAENLGKGITVSSESDTRITKVGKFLRKTSLDELPQLINVLAGTMSLIGPRPPVVYHPYDGYDNYPEWAKKRFEMRPGITGLAQARVRDSATWDERIVIDNEYIDNFSVWMDIKVVLLTVKTVVKSENMYTDNEAQSEERDSDVKEHLPM